MNGKWSRSFAFLLIALLAKGALASPMALPSTALCGSELATIGLAPEALAQVRLPEAALSALGRLHLAVGAWERAVDAFREAPTDETTRERYAPFAPYEALFQAYRHFLRSAEDIRSLEAWPEEERESAARSGLEEELAATMERARAVFDEEWHRLGRRFLDGSLGRDGQKETLSMPPVRIRFSDREVRDFFERCRAENPASVERCAGGMPWARHARLALRRLELVNATRSLDDLKSRTKELKHYSAACRYAGYYAIEIDHKYRLIFHWDFESGTAYDVFIENYHAE
jgi:plasmid maintenance system killer protein